MVANAQTQPRAASATSGRTPYKTHSTEETGQVLGSREPHPTSTTCTSPGPCIPTKSDISISPDRLGPVWKQTLAGNLPTSPPAYFSIASGTVRKILSTGTTAMYVGGSSVTVRPFPGPPSRTRVPVSAIAHSAVESPISALPAISLKSARSRHTATSTPVSPSGPSTPSSSSCSTSHLSRSFASLSRARPSTYLRASSRLSTLSPWPPRASSSSINRVAGSSMGLLSPGSVFLVHATSGAFVGL